MPRYKGDGATVKIPHEKYKEGEMVELGNLLNF
jgi:hypothetical protein